MLQTRTFTTLERNPLLLPLGVAAFGAGLSKIGQDAANAENAEQAQLNRDFQERMSNTSYQRARADLEAAGFNPMLAVSQGGASSPSGSSAAAMQNTLSGAAQSTSLIPNSLIQAAQIKNIQADTQKKLTETDAAKTDLYYLAPFLENRNDQAIKRLQMLDSEQQYQLKFLVAELRQAQASGEQADIETATAKLRQTLTRLGIPQAEAEADYYRGAGKYAPYLGGARQLLDLFPGKLNLNFGGSGSAAQDFRGHFPGRNPSPRHRFSNGNLIGNY